jgi:aspartate/methionine/tyrosine aminotransferase
MAHDIVVAPGAFFGPEGEGFVRMAMVPTLEDCARAVEVLDAALPDAAVAV